MTGIKDYRALRLEAMDTDDLAAMSACMQDCVAKLGDFAYLPERRRFAFVGNRFVWEVAGRLGPFWRVRSGLHFDDVLSVSRQNLRVDADDAIVELLAIRYEAQEDGGFVFLDFAGGGGVRLQVEAVNAHLSDISAPWRTQSKPDHEG